MKADQIAHLFQVDWFDFQLKAFAEWEALPEYKRYCLYYRTGAGKTLTSLSMMRMDGVTDLLVIAPPITHKKWIADADVLGMKLEIISHAKFRMKDYKTSRSRAVICDEFHLLGGQRGQGWLKFSRMARVLKAPAIIMSATPNYNDAERVYCIQHVLDPNSTKGGFLNFLYTHCKTKHNPFGQVPLVEGFLRFESAEEYLSKLKRVGYVPDTNTIPIIDADFYIGLPKEVEDFGLFRNDGRIAASIMELSHKTSFYKRVHFDGSIHAEVLDVLMSYLDTDEKVLIYVNRARIAKILYEDLLDLRVKDVRLITGKTPKQKKAEELEEFISGDTRVLIGTATLATGADGMDKVCHNLLIFDDTPDDSLRRQVMGRILPRGAGADQAVKNIVRYNFL